jgi:hypothetical protein
MALEPLASAEYWAEVIEFLLAVLVAPAERQLHTRCAVPGQ